MQLTSIQNLNKKHIVLLLCAFYILFFFLVCTSIPYGDDFWFLKVVNDFYNVHTFADKLHVIIAQFNLGLNFNNTIDYTEHRHIIHKLILVADVYLTGNIHIKTYLLFNVLSLLILYRVFYLLFKEEMHDNTVFCSVFLILFTVVNYLNISWMASLSNNILLMLGFLSLYLNQQKKYAMSVVSLLIALLSSYGAFIFFLINIIYLALRLQKAAIAYIVFLFISFYFYNQGLVNSDTYSLAVKLKYSWFVIWLFFCSLGSIGLNAIPATLIGILYVVFFFFLVKKKIYKTHPMLFSLILFIFITCFGIAFKRCNLGFSYILNTRFRQFSMLLTAFYIISLKVYYPSFFEKLKKTILISAIFYFIAGTTVSFYVANQRKNALIDGVKKYKQNQTGLFIYKGVYENKNTQIKVNEVNTIMKELIEENHYDLP